MQAGLDIGSGPSFLQGNRPTTISVVLLVCSFNLVSIPPNICNPVEYFCNIVMINFMFGLSQVLHCI
jgi:hypothetical protein